MIQWIGLTSKLAVHALSRQSVAPLLLGHRLDKMQLRQQKSPSLLLSQWIPLYKQQTSLSDVQVICYFAVINKKELAMRRHCTQKRAAPSRWEFYLENFCKQRQIIHYPFHYPQQARAPKLRGVPSSQLLCIADPIK